MLTKTAVARPANHIHREPPLSDDSEAKLLEAQEVAQLGFYVLDLRTELWTSSETLDRIVDIPDDYPRTVQGWAALVHPEDRQSRHPQATCRQGGQDQAQDRVAPQGLRHRPTPPRSEERPGPLTGSLAGPS